jgi:hypothetical protein
LVILGVKCVKEEGRKVDREVMNSKQQQLRDDLQAVRALNHRMQERIDTLQTTIEARLKVDRERLKAAQGGRCAICGVVPRFPGTTCLLKGRTAYVCRSCGGQ